MRKLAQLKIKQYKGAQQAIVKNEIDLKMILLV